MTTVREVRATDWPVISELGECFYREAPELGEFDGGIFTANWTQWLDMGMAIALVLEIDGTVRGFIGALVAPEACCSRIQAQELAWFVHPEFRGQGLRLLKKLEIECFDRGCSTLAMIALRSLNAEKLDRLYRRMGYTPIETVYRKSIP